MIGRQVQQCMQWMQFVEPVAWRVGGSSISALAYLHMHHTDAGVCV
jgi:hypothetical protein